MAQKNSDIYASRGTHESGNFAELTVEQKPVGKAKLKKILRTLIKIAWIIGMLYAIFSIGGIFIFLGAILLATGTWFISYITTPLVLTEYRYSILAGDMCFDKFSGGRYYKEDILKIKIADMSVIAPYHDEELKKLADAPDIVNRYEYCSEMAEPDLYFAIFEQNGQKSVVFFDATQKALKIMKFLNKDAITMRDVRR